ncbi:SPOR domain-containing protein [Oceanicola sp. S124]|uniref:SPOR domain-containing protein n=1 Tax=Oceanicola sp. S124 TaxID=1042378 RepID=UPI000255A71D|nr:SPOR domain-containing protein [Oceanicola sp. S124]
MADFPADAPYASHDAYPETAAGPAAAAPSFGSLVTWVGGALSVALIAGVGVWGYRMVMRDVSGVPVVRAMSGETRRAPDAAGGSETPFQGLAVNHIAASKAAEAPPESVRLAPAPLGLGTDDPAPEEVAARQPAAEPEAPAEELASADEPVLQPAPLNLADVDRIEELANALAGDAAPLEPMQPRTVPAAAPREGSGFQAVRPKLRPDTLLASVAARQVAGPVSVEPQVLDVSADSLPAGTRLAQLGAFASQEIAESEWDRFVARFGIYLEDKQRVIQRAESGGRIFYRLRVLGFDDISDSRRFCAALVAEGADCIPVSAK